MLKFNENSEILKQLLNERPTAVLLLVTIATNMTRNPETGKMEALIKGASSYGVTDRIYRTDIERLTRDKQATTRKTNRGLVFTLEEYDIFNFFENGKTSRETSNRRATDNQQVQNKKIEENIKKGNTKENSDCIILEYNNIKYNIPPRVYGKIKGDIILSPDILWEVTKHFKVHYKYVLSKFEAILESLENGDKYKVISMRGTLSNWIRMAIDRGQAEVITDAIEWDIEANMHDPARIEKNKIIKQKIEEEERSGKPYIDLSRFLPKSGQQN